MSTINPQYIKLDTTSLCIYCVYEYFKMEELMDNIDDEFEREVSFREDLNKKSEPKPLALSVEKDLLYQSNAEIEFPTVRFSTPKIPHIIHFVFRNTTIPFGLVQNVRSFYENNRKWEFRFWTFKSGRKLIKQHHPYLLNTYDSWTGGPDGDEQKSNMLRFVALYEYGGFSGDLDIDNLRSLDIATKKYGCIIPPVPFEQSAIIYNFDLILTSSVLLCRPKHPFFKPLLEHMQYVDRDGSVFDISGGGHITRNYLEYNKLKGTDLRKKKTDDKSNSPFFYKGERSEDDEDAVYVPNTQYFFDDIDPGLLQNKSDLTECSERDSLKPYLIKRACVEFESRRELRSRQQYAFTSKPYLEIWKKHYTPRVIHIKKIIPKVIIHN